MAETESSDFRTLMIAANSGDKAAYAQLLHALTPLIRGIIRGDRGFVGADEVEDVVQEVLLSVHSVRATYDANRPFMPWLLAIVRRRIIDAGRRRIRQAQREVEFDDTDVTFAAAETNTLDEDIARTDALRIAIERLPRAQRRAIELLKIRELSLREASAATGMSIGALKVAAHRGIAALRGKLK
jgi:RNA polymerase sigma-70 factor (ECF subfamily)